MASSSVQGITSSSSSSSSPPLYMYDVFLSFRGKDTRNNFTSHLCSNLAQRGIDVYMDDSELERGKTIEPALWKAIEESRFSVIIFSRDYASSPWCLDELVKIVQCMKEMGQTVLPVFYDVDPSEVAERKGQYEKAFVEHEQNFKENLEKVRNWKDCLSTVANLSGWDIRNSFTILEQQQLLEEQEELLEEQKELEVRQLLLLKEQKELEVRQVLLLEVPQQQQLQFEVRHLQQQLRLEVLQLQRVLRLLKEQNQKLQQWRQQKHQQWRQQQMEQLLIEQLDEQLLQWRLDQLWRQQQLDEQLLDQQRRQWLDEQQVQRRLDEQRVQQWLDKQRELQQLPGFWLGIELALA